MEKWLLKDYVATTFRNSGLMILRLPNPQYLAHNSSDFKSMEYVWGEVEKDTNFTTCNIKAQLIDRVLEAFVTLPRDTVKAEYARLRSLIVDLTDAEAGSFEGIIIVCLFSILQKKEKKDS